MESKETRDIECFAPHFEESCYLQLVTSIWGAAESQTNETKEDIIVSFVEIVILVEVVIPFRQNLLIP